MTPRELFRAGAASLPLLLLSSCGHEAPPPPATTSTAAPTATEAAPPPPPPRAHLAPPVREGSALARAADSSSLFLADEDHTALRKLPLPLGAPLAARDMPGRPAQVLPLDGHVLVTVRDPGLLLVLRSDDLTEEARIAVPPDAWSLAVTPDEKIALVTSAWSHAVTAVDLDSRKVLWSIDVGREPRGVVIAQDASRAYVTHLIGDRVTRIEELRGPPRAGTFPLWIQPTKSPPRAPAAPRGGSLAYAAVLSPDGSRLFIPRHHIGGMGPLRWFGDPSVDVVSTRDDTMLLPPHSPGPSYESEFAQAIGAQGEGLPSFVVPRAAVYRKRTGTLLLASEATDALLELDAQSLLPSEQPLRTHRLGRHYDVQITAAKEGGAPSAIALSDDERRAYVFCRSTYDIAEVDLDSPPTSPSDPVTITRVAADPLTDEEAIGRRLYYTAMDPVVTDGASCATCHPDGRDDGFVWREHEGHFLSIPMIQGFPVTGAARQTPMIAGRVNAQGPYGWLAESPNLKSRIIAGFELHRWFDEQTQPMRSKQIAAEDTKPGDPQLKHRGDYLAQFLRKGLVPPPASASPLPADLAERGKALFSDEKVGCAGCHVPATDYTNRAAVVLSPARNAPDTFDEAPATAYKTPSLLYVAGTAPYFHDGSADTLQELIDKNGDRMGKTSHLSAADRGALVAFLQSIGSPPAATGAPTPSMALPLGSAAPLTASAAPIASASAQPPASAEPPASAQPPASGSASAGQTVRHTRKPTPADWKTAEPLEVRHGTKPCSALKLREYIRVRCEVGAYSAYVKAGPTQNVEFWSGKIEKGMFAVFPLYPGDRRVLVFTDAVGVGKYGALEVPGDVISATWLDGEPPVITID